MRQPRPVTRCSAFTAGNAITETTSAMTTAKLTATQQIHPVIMKQGLLGSSDGFGHLMAEMAI